MTEGQTADAVRSGERHTAAAASPFIAVQVPGPGGSELNLT